ncbi:class I SAM-dependent methyltransferase [Luteolibacter sp. SL250]|uniref:class I SAM-dependent methyltransferase n=1 Tax=Luteolibacter sp. SL250 TaxID=2995170 RepID=UPI0022715F30|nr:class I SAM-dependent methyltransferase [Luteolibacter sp. SL250]WAC17957.1 class I SAM-dependent methyltransferase [Luteolibacter sp. SL250]
MSFDRIAPWYGPMEGFLAGGCMHRARLWLMEGNHVPAKVLMVGEGPGRFLKAFRIRFPDAEMTVVDASARMLEIARRRLGDHRGVTFVHARVEDWDTDQRFDLIVTNFLLDCLPQRGVEETVAKLGGLTMPNAEWWIADFNLPEGVAAGWRSRVILRLLYLFFGNVAGVQARDLHPPDAALEQAGLIRIARMTWSWGLLKGERWRKEVGGKWIASRKS